MPRPLTLTDTLADHHSLSRVSAHCLACGHSVVLDTWTLGVRLGWDVPLVDLAQRLRCTRCNARGCRVATSLRRPQR